jgi:hypothetical protein
VVTHPSAEDSVYPLRQWDVITAIGDVPIDDQGMVKVGPNLRVAFTYLVQHTAQNGKVPLSIFRAGKSLNVDVPVSSTYPALLPSLAGAYPSYFIFGPIVFAEGTAESLGVMSKEANSSEFVGKMALRGNPLIARLGDKQAFEGERLVVVASPFFPHSLSKGYSSHVGQVVKAVNGHPIKNLRHLIEVLRDNKDEFITIDFGGLHPSESLVFPHAETIAATEGILTDNGIRSQSSPDVADVWPSK